MLADSGPDPGWPASAQHPPPGDSRVEEEEAERLFLRVPGVRAFLSPTLATSPCPQPSE